MTRSLVSALLLLSLLSLPLAAEEPRLTTSLFTEQLRFDPGTDITILAAVFNVTDASVLGPQLRVAVPAGVSVKSLHPPAGWTAAIENGAVVFRAGELAPRKSAVPAVSFVAPADRDGHRLHFTAVASSRERAFESEQSIDASVFRIMIATNVLDAGPGSLRDRIVDANAHCRGEFPCKVTMELTTLEPREILLASPLPAITATDVSIGATGFGPETPLNFDVRGDALTSGHGFEIRSLNGQVTLHHIAISNFPGNGVAIVDAGGPAETYGRTVTLQTVNIEGSGQRGIAVADPFAHVVVLDAELLGNKRSGIAAWAARSLNVSYSSIGVSRGGVAIPNGASGVYVGPGVQASVISTTIAHQPDFGVAVARGAKATVTNSRFFANGVLDFDIGLDGPTPNDDESDGIPNTPVLTSATYVPSIDKTIVTGRIETHGKLGWQFNVGLYVSDQVNRFGIAVAERPDGHAAIAVTDGRPIARDFTIELRGDQRGKYVSAQMHVQRFFDTPWYAASELSSALEIQ